MLSHNLEQNNYYVYSLRLTCLEMKLFLTFNFLKGLYNVAKNDSKSPSRGQIIYILDIHVNKKFNPTFFKYKRRFSSHLFQRT